MTEPTTPPADPRLQGTVEIPRRLAYRIWGLLAQECSPCQDPECQITSNPATAIDECCDQLHAALAAPQAQAAPTPDMAKIEKDCLAYAGLSCLGSVTEAYRWFHAQGKTEKDFNACAWDAMAKAVKHAVALTAREVRDPVWPYLASQAAPAAPEPTDVQITAAAYDLGLVDHVPLLGQWERVKQLVRRFAASQAAPAAQPASQAAPLTKLDRFVQMVRLWVERDRGDMDAALAWMYSEREAAPAAAEPPEQGAEAPPHSLPTWTECERIINNHEFRQRAAAGLEGAVLDTAPTTPPPSELHRFIYEYDDANGYRSGWFMHRLERVIQEARAAAEQPSPAQVREWMEAMESAHKLFNACGPHLQGVGQECCGNYESDYGAEYMGQREVVPVCCGQAIDLSDHVANELRGLEAAIAAMRAYIEQQEKRHG